MYISIVCEEGKICCFEVIISNHRKQNILKHAGKTENDQTEKNKKWKQNLGTARRGEEEKWKLDEIKWRAVV